VANLWTHPQAFFVTAFDHLTSRGIAVVPLLGQPGVIGHGSTLTEFIIAANTEGAGYGASRLCQISHGSRPLMIPAASMNAAWAAQPDLLMGFMSEISWRFA
jgi:hypothetical protein